MRSRLLNNGISFALPESLAKGGRSMSLERRRKKKILRTKNEKRMVKESLREFLGDGILESNDHKSLSLFLLKDALNFQILNSISTKN